MKSAYDGGETLQYKGTASQESEHPAKDAIEEMCSSQRHC